MFRMWRPIRLFSMRSLIILCSECEDLLDCSVCGAFSYYVQRRVLANASYPGVTALI